jgi:hypothetical protein
MNSNPFYATARLPPRDANKDLSASPKHKHPASVLIDEGQHEGDDRLFDKSIEGAEVSTGDAPVGTFSVAIHPAATPGKDTPS